MVGVLLIYSFTRSALFNLDGMGYANTVKNSVGIPFSNGNHVLYPAIGYTLYRIFESDPLFLLQVLNIALGTVGVYLLAGIAARLLNVEREWMAPAIVSLGMAFSYGYWFHSTDAEDIMIGTVALLAAIRVCLPGDPSKMKMVSLPAASVLLAFATLCHANLILGTLPLLVAVYQRTARGSERILHVLCLLALTLVVLVTVTMAIAVWGVGVGSWEEVQQWLGYGVSSQWSVWGSFHSKAILKASYGAFKSLVSMPMTYERLSIFLDEGTALEKIGWAGAQFATAALIGAVVIRSLDSLRHRVSFGLSSCLGCSDGKVPILCFAWIIPLGTATALWAPGDVEFWVPVLPALWLLLGWLVTIHPNPRPSMVFASILVLILFLSNLTLSFCPASDPANNIGLKRASVLKEKTESGDLVITPGANWITTYVAYFAERPVFDFELETNQTESFELAMSKAKSSCNTALLAGHSVWVGSLWDEGSDKLPFWEFLLPLGIQPAPLRKLFSAYPTTHRERILDETFLVIK
jgi:hypothetical protein